MCFTSNVSCSLRLISFDTEGQTMWTDHLTKKLQNWNQNSRQPWVSLIGLWTTRPWLDEKVARFFKPIVRRRKCKTNYFSTLKWKPLKVVKENLVREITLSSSRHRFRGAPFLKCYPSTLKLTGGVFKFLQFEERFRKALCFDDALMWTIGLTVEIKLHFQFLWPSVDGF